MKDRRATTVILASLGVCLAVAPPLASAGEKCQSVWLHVGQQTAYDPGKCPYPYDGSATPTAELGCYVASVVGTLNGTWIYYWPAPDNCIRIKSEDMPGSGWREGKELWACWALSVFKTRGGDLYAEAGEMTHSDAFSMPSLGYVDFEILTGGTGRFRGATGWLAAGADELNGGVFVGRLCTTAPHKSRK